MNGRENKEGVAENPELLTAEHVDGDKMLMINARLRSSADTLQDLAFDLAGLESADVIADLIQMSVALQRILDRREAA